MANRSSFRDLDTGGRIALAVRLRVMIDAAGSQSDAAKAAQVSVRQLRMYATGASAPSFLSVARLAEATGYSLDWVYTGSGEARSPTIQAAQGVLLDAGFMGRLVEAIAGAYKLSSVTLPDRVLGALAAKEYMALVTLAATEDEQESGAKLVRQKYERKLAGPVVVPVKRGR